MLLRKCLILYSMFFIRSKVKSNKPYKQAMKHFEYSHTCDDDYHIHSFFQYIIENSTYLPHIFNAIKYIQWASTLSDKDLCSFEVGLVA